MLSLSFILLTSVITLLLVLMLPIVKLISKSGGVNAVFFFIIGNPAGASIFEFFLDDSSKLFSLQVFVEFLLEISFRDLIHKRKN
jgi:hypothetical protein